MQSASTSLALVWSPLSPSGYPTAIEGWVSAPTFTRERHALQSKGRVKVKVKVNPSIDAFRARHIDFTYPGLDRRRRGSGTAQAFVR